MKMQNITRQQTIKILWLDIIIAFFFKWIGCPELFVASAYVLWIAIKKYYFYSLAPANKGHFF